MGKIECSGEETELEEGWRSEDRRGMCQERKGDIIITQRIGKERSSDHTEAVSVSLQMS